MARLGLDFRNRFAGMTIAGSDEFDSIFGRGGNDTLIGFHGDDHLYGGTGDDRIFAGNGAVYDFWGSDTVEGGDGSDTISFYYSLDPVTIWGDNQPNAAHLQDGNDTIWGGRASDTIIGGGGDDTIYGGLGDDYIVTDYGAGIGTGPGYLGTNTVVGGRGQDTVICSGFDTIIIEQGDSAPFRSTADIIVGFERAHARLDLPGDATASNYNETYIQGQGFDSALSMANYLLRKADYVFITDGRDGYVFADTNGDSRADIGTILTGVTSTDQFSHEYIM